MKYFSKSTDATSMPKFVLYSAHAETVAPILHALKHPLLLNPEPSAMVLVNYYGCRTCSTLDEDRTFVEVSFSPQYRLGQSVETLSF